MTRSAEKNDIDITKLFKYEKEVEITDQLSKQSAKFYLRLVGDADLNRARVFGLRSSGNMRKELKTENSDMRVGFMCELPEFNDKDTLIQAILILGLGETQRVAINMTEVPEPKAPKLEANLEELEKYQQAVDNYENDYRKALEKNIRKVQNKSKKRYEKLEMGELYRMYEGLIIDKLCSEEMANRYYQMCVYYGTYADPKYKKRAFKSFDDFDNAATMLKNRLMEEYRILELGIDELKKLPEATE